MPVRHAGLMLPAKSAVFVASAFWLTATCQAEFVYGTPALRGALLSVDLAARSLTVRDRSGHDAKVMLAPDALIVVGHPLPRSDLRVGDVVAVTATDIKLPYERLLVGGAYMQADRSVPAREKERLAREFLPSSGLDIEEAQPSRTALISGRLIANDPTSILIRSGRIDITVKMSPEATGEILHPGSLSDLRPGLTVAMALLQGGVRSVLVTDGHQP